MVDESFVADYEILREAFTELKEEHREAAPAPAPTISTVSLI